MDVLNGIIILFPSCAHFGVFKKKTIERNYISVSFAILRRSCFHLLFIFIFRDAEKKQPQVQCTSFLLLTRKSHIFNNT